MRWDDDRMEVAPGHAGDCYVMEEDGDGGTLVCTTVAAGAAAVYAEPGIEDNRLMHNYVSALVSFAGGSNAAMSAAGGDGRRPRPDRRCWGCASPDHVLVDCPHKDEERTRANARPHLQEFRRTGAITPATNFICPAQWEDLGFKSVDEAEWFRAIADAATTKCARAALQSKLRNRMKNVT